MKGSFKMISNLFLKEKIRFPFLYPILVLTGKLMRCSLAESKTPKRREYSTLEIKKYVD